MPVEGVGAAGVPVPFHLFVQTVAELAQHLAGGPLPCGEEPLHQERGFHQIAAIVELAEREGLPGVAVVPMGPGSVEAGQELEIAGDLAYALGGVFPAQPTALGPGDNRHDAEAGTAGSDDIAVGVFRPFARHAGVGLSEGGEVFEGLPLHLVEQGFVSPGKATRGSAGRKQQTRRQ